MAAFSRSENPSRKALSFHGYYGSRIAAHGGLFLWSAALALLATFISYPGIWYSDSYVRVTTGGAVLNAVIKTLTGHRAYLNTDNAFTIVPSFFMAFSQGLTGHVGLYTFLQAFAFFAATAAYSASVRPGHCSSQAWNLGKGCLPIPIRYARVKAKSQNPSMTRESARGRNTP